MQIVKPKHKILTLIVGDEILKHIEVAGRTCYQSDARITDSSAKAFVDQIVQSGHESVLEHESISVQLTIDRGVSHELVRHRIASYSQESTRYCCYKDHVTFILPCWMKDVPTGVYTRDSLNYIKGDRTIISYESELWLNTMYMLEVVYLDLLQRGWKSQQARCVLPNSLKTEIVITANLREWRHIFKLRTSERAHPQMREIMEPLLQEFRNLVPIVFDTL